MLVLKMDTLFLTLRVFSATGGIEKVCRIAGKALHEIAAEKVGQKLHIFSLYDEPADVGDKYFPATIFTGFGKKRGNFMSTAMRQGFLSKMVILSHVNLLMVGFLIKLVSPKTKLVLLAHGIEVWRTFPAWKKMMLRKCDLILPVSDFTKHKMMDLYSLPDDKFITLNNCLDPFLALPHQHDKDAGLLAQYGIHATDKVLMSLTRLAYKERYKGYDQVIEAVYQLKETYPSIKYLIVGKYDDKEKERLDTLIARLSLQKQIILTGFIPDEAVAAHFNLADLYIMPSQKEGFGIVFIEAMFYGKAVIAGNIDGSVDALKNGLFGLLVNPAQQQEITDAIVKVFNNIEKYIPKHEEVLQYFSYAVYKDKLRAVLSI